MMFREEFSRKGSNAAALNAGVTAALEYQSEAEKHKNLPHNAFTLSNLDTNCTLFIYLDDMSDQNKPDYVLFPQQTISVGIEDGITFSTLWIKNTHASSNIAANSIKHRIATIKRVL